MDLSFQNWPISGCRVGWEGRKVHAEISDLTRLVAICLCCQPEELIREKVLLLTAYWYMRMVSTTLMIR
jgi:hypothetical protein